MASLSSVSRIVGGTAGAVFLTALVLGGAAVAPGCGGSNGSPDGGNGGLDLTLFCGASIDMLCQEEATCQPKTFQYPSVEVCKQAQQAVCAATSNFSAALGINFGAGISFNEAALQDCVAKKNALGPSCNPPPNITSADVIAERAACDPHNLIGSGSRAAGASCQIEFQCQSGLTCSTETANKPDASICGNCVPLAEGAPCTENSDCGVALGLTCDRTAKICKRYGNVGDTCSSDLPCDPTKFLGCTYSEKVCKPFAKSGEPCTDIDCDKGLFLYCGRVDSVCKDIPRHAGDSCKPEGICGYGLYCNATTFQCTANVPIGGDCSGQAAAGCDPNLGLDCSQTTHKCESSYAQVGEDCGQTSGKPCWQSFCAIPTGQFNGKCIAFGVDGSDCTIGDDEACSEDFQCRDGKCQSPAAELEGLDASALAAAEGVQTTCP